MKLYSYFRSSCSYRLRIALNLKGVGYDYIAVNVVQREQQQNSYLALNPLGLVPALEVAPDEFLGQSIALLEWLEETHPEPALLPQDVLQRARVRAAVSTIACDIQPICNIGVTNELKLRHSASDENIQQWFSTWMHRGFIALEAAVSVNKTSYCFGETPGIADVCLVPQVYNARRMDVDMTPFPHLSRISDNCNALPAFEAARPELQPDSTL